MENRKFEGVWIPAKLWLCTDIKLLHKVFLVEINSLDNEQGCFKNNAGFAKFFGLSKSRVSHVISELEELGYITIEFEYKPNSKEVARRIIHMDHDVLNAKLSEFEPIADVQGGIAKTQGGIAEIAMRDIQPSNTIEKDLKDGQPHDDSSKDAFLNKVKQDAKEIASKRKNKVHTMLDKFCEERPRLQKLIWDYYKIRVVKGLQPKQMQIILEDINTYAKTDAKAMEYLRSAIAGGFMQVVPVWVTDPNYKPKGKKFDPNAKPVSKADNTSGSEYSRKKPKRKDNWQEELDLATDDDGNVLKF